MVGVITGCYQREVWKCGKVKVGLLTRIEQFFELVNALEASTEPEDSLLCQSL